MQVSIETAKQEDYLDIGALIRNELGYAEKDFNELKETFRMMLEDKSYSTYVAKVEGKIAGFMNLCKNLTFEAEGKVVRVTALAVDHTCQRMGIGAKLLAQAERYAAENNINYITLTSGMHRAGAHLFYEHSGYEKKGLNFKKYL
jgi:Acetyltransferases